MRKQDLKIGQIVEVRKGNKYIITSDDFKHPNKLNGVGSFIHLSSFKDDLTTLNSSDSEFDIVKVYEVGTVYSLYKNIHEHGKISLEDTGSKLTWERL